MRVQPTPPSSQPLPEVRVTTDADGLVGHAGLRLLTDLADRLGLTREPGRHANAGVRLGALDRGRVLRDLAVTLAAGGTAVSDLAVLRTQPGLFGHVASTSTAWRVLGEVGAEAGKLAGVWLALASASRRVWAQGGAPPARPPACPATGPDPTRTATQPRRPGQHADPDHHAPVCRRAKLVSPPNRTHTRNPELWRQPTHFVKNRGRR